MFLPIRLITMTLALSLTVPLPAHAADWKKVEEALGAPGSMQPGEVYKFSLPRTDLEVTLEGVAIKPALALGSWLAFQEKDDEAVVMGDLVLTEEEVNPVMARLAAGGIEVTALHNHLLRSSPPTLYLHVAGRGDPVAMAKTLRTALALSKTPFPSAPGNPSSQALDLDTEHLDQTLGYKGKAEGGVYKFAVPRVEAIQAHGLPIVPSMGTATVLNFQPTGGGKAAIHGDFVLLAEEVNPVLRVLREHGIEVTALHNHMLTEEPRLFFLHFWAYGEAGKLARGLRAALDKINAQR